ncbi:uncharacterized protein LOC122492612 [Prionailurus bengalensis]|uniref:uncharacterized protein LOC122492612 n=1 Tax=Prionailurus bengalensis TaxID=37029 RepID=UPI001CA98361|nr:uncharacterized protein LOC122492612 [Prionailurus bengalensis]
MVIKNIKVISNQMDFQIMQSPAFLLTKTITHKVFTFKRNVRRIKPSGESVRTLFEVPNLEYKGRLSVLYSSPETFRLSSCPRDRRAKESTPLPPRPPSLRPTAKPGLKTFATGRRNYKGGRLPPLSWIWELSAFVAIGFPPPAPASLILGICVRSHSQSRQPGVAQPRLRRDQRNSGEDLVGGHNERKMKKERKWKYPHSPEENKTTNM